MVAPHHQACPYSFSLMLSQPKQELHTTFLTTLLNVILQTLFNKDSFEQLTKLGC